MQNMKHRDDAGRVVDALELLVHAALAVDVVPEVDVRVEDLDAGR